MQTYLTQNWIGFNVQRTRYATRWEVDVSNYGVVQYEQMVPTHICERGKN